MKPRATLRTRLVASFMIVALVVIALSGITTYLVVRRSLQQHALDNLRSRADALPGVYQDLTAATPELRPKQRLARLAAGLKLTDMAVVQVTAHGQVLALPGDTLSLPAPLGPTDLLPNALQANQIVSGRRGNIVYLAVPAQTVANRTIVVVATDTVDMNVLNRSVPLMILAGAIVLGLALVIALWLARRLTRPIHTIEQTAREITNGNLGARADVPPSTDDELAVLASTLNDMASQLEQARGSERAFLLSVSHDLRTPLTSIRGYAEALADGTLDDADPNDRKRAATVISAEARRLERLVRDLLDLSRLDTHQFSLTVRPCDATEVVRDAAEAFTPKAQELSITLNVMSGQPLPVELDPERLAQIVANLVENALKYARSTVDVYAAPYSDHEIAVVVSDDGPGIPPDKLGRVFERLYTVRETPGRSVGTGLGLAIVRELAAAMHGTAWADAAVEHGSRFVVSLPNKVTP